MFLTAFGFGVVKIFRGYVEVDSLEKTLFFTRTKSDKNWPRTSMPNIKICHVFKKINSRRVSLSQHVSWVFYQSRRPSENYKAVFSLSYKNETPSSVFNTRALELLSGPWYRLLTESPSRIWLIDCSRTEFTGWQGLLDFSSQIKSDKNHFLILNRFWSGKKQCLLQHIHSNFLTELSHLSTLIMSLPNNLSRAEMFHSDKI